MIISCLPETDETRGNFVDEFCFGAIRRAPVSLKSQIPQNNTVVETNKLPLFLCMGPDSVIDRAALKRALGNSLNGGGGGGSSGSRKAPKLVFVSAKDLDFAAGAAGPGGSGNICPSSRPPDYIARAMGVFAERYREYAASESFLETVDARVGY